MNPWIAAFQVFCPFPNSCQSSWWCHPTISILCHPLLLPPSIFCIIRVFLNESVPCIKRPKCWSFSFSITPSDEYSGMISFRIYWFNLFAVQGTSKSLLQHHSSKSLALQCSAFFMVQLSTIHDYWKQQTTTTFFGKAMSLLFTILSRLVITFLPRSKCLLISWLQSTSAVILETKKNKACHCFHCFPICLPQSDETRCHDLSFLNIEF